ncbi:hypothetical protein BU16DRAFT_532470 [Lophium mytilinum]|uniref:Uncharacterized protein n=1 Tax=Lophium mytilinum TaxID=390894 RepID=A0A6A6RB76_9PEZI|nr:hypothetical protein BU16DRAFT_532470 [Lophium mytilinum]
MTPRRSDSSGHYSLPGEEEQSLGELDTPQGLSNASYTPATPIITDAEWSCILDFNLQASDLVSFTAMSYPMTKTNTTKFPSGSIALDWINTLPLAAEPLQHSPPPRLNAFGLGPNVTVSASPNSSFAVHIPPPSINGSSTTKLHADPGTTRLCAREGCNNLAPRVKKGRFCSRKCRVEAAKLDPAVRRCAREGCSEPAPKSGDSGLFCTWVCVRKANETGQAVPAAVQSAQDGDDEGADGARV